MTKAMEFSDLGDQVFNSFADCFKNVSRKRLCFGQPLSTHQHQQIRSAAAQYISSCLESPRLLSEQELLSQLIEKRSVLRNYTSGGVLMPMREQSLEFTALHKTVASTFASYGIEEHVDAIDLPFNMRLVYGNVDARRAQQPFASSKLHCDVWAGVPSDAVVIVVPLFGDIDNITIELGEMARETELSAMQITSDYDELKHIQMATPYDDVKLQHGFAYFADTRLMHRTVRHRNEGLRISLDFRFRLPNKEYRAMVPEAVGPDAMTSTVSYRDWLNVGTETALLFNTSIEDPRAREMMNNSSPVNTRAYTLRTIQSDVVVARATTASQSPASMG
jgi:hypothetical protein